MLILISATRLVQIHLAQLADTVTFPLHFALLIGFLPVGLVFLVKCFLIGISYARKILVIVIGLFVALCTSWYVVCKTFQAGETGAMVNMFVGIGVSWIVAVVLVVAPAEACNDNMRR